MPRGLAILTVFMPLVTSGSLFGQSVLRVDENATGPLRDGSNWCQAFVGLPEAMDVAVTGDVIRVADGTYLPSITGMADPREATFQLVTGVSIEGGYAGCGAPDPDARDFDLYHSILSCDLAGDDATGGSNSENCRHVVTASSVDASAVLDGVTITAGNADGTMEDRNGGGMFVIGGGPTLIDCTFRANTAVFGGGLFNSQGAPALTGCTFDANSALVSGGGMYNYALSPLQDSAVLLDCVFVGNDATGYGGGMRNYDSTPTLTNCTFDDNFAIERGGGMANGGASSPRLDNCRFTGNRVQSFTLDAHGGGMSNYDDSDPVLAGCTFEGNLAIGPNGLGGALFNSGTAPTLTRCAFAANVAFHGGAIYNDAGRPFLTNCVFRANVADVDGGGMYSFSSGGDPPLTLINTVFSGNSAAGDGGALFSDLSTLTLINCTLSRNTAGSQGGGLYNYVGCDVAVTNSILWNNSDMNGSIEDSQVFNKPSNSLTPNHTCIQGLTGGLGGLNNISDDPWLVDAVGTDGEAGTVDDDLRLASDSPCIEAGDNAVVTEAFDLGGNPRIVDYDGDGTDSVDMGAYESQIFGDPVPAVSDWCVVVLMLFVLTAGTLVLMRRRMIL